MTFILISLHSAFYFNKPVFSNHLSYVTLFQCYIGRSHKTGFTKYLFKCYGFSSIFCYLPFSAQFSTPKDSRERSNSLTPLIDSQNKSNMSLPASDTSSSETKKKKRISLGSISKVFTRGRARRSIAVPTGTELEGTYL